MENTTLKDAKTEANKLLSEVFDKEIINYKLDFKSYDDDRLGGYAVESIIELAPRLYINREYRDIFISEGIYAQKEHQKILVDTVLHEYGHMVYDIIGNSQNRVSDSVDDFLRKKVFELVRVEDISENGNLVYRVLKAGGEEVGVFDEDELSEYLEYEAEEFFAENLVTYLRLKENNPEYSSLNSGLEMEEKTKDFYSIVLNQVKGMKKEYFEEESTLRLRSPEKISFGVGVYEDETKITVYSYDKPVGSCDFQIQDMDTFVQYEIDEYLDQREEDGDIEGYEVDKFMDMKNRFESKSLVYLISSLEIKKEYRGKGFGQKLLREVLGYIGREIAECKMPESIIYLNASPSYGSLPLPNLVEFYKKSGFEEQIRQENNSLMAVMDAKKISELLNKEKETSKKVQRK